MITLTGGTILLMWIGEQITSRGVGNGISLIIFAGIVARFPQLMGQALESARTGATNPLLLLAFAVFAAALVAFIVFMERAQRRLFVTYPKRQVGNKVYGGESSHLPLKLNVSGVIPPIFASSILLLPTTVASFNAQNLPGWLQTIVTYVSRGQPLYLIALCGADPLLRLLLYLGGVQSGGDGGESEEIWRRLSRASAPARRAPSSSTIR